MTNPYNERARWLRNAAEPVGAGVYFAAEAHAAHAASEKLGFDPSPAAPREDGIARPEMKSYFTSRGAFLRRVSGEVVAGPHFGSGLTIDTAAGQYAGRG